jgi:hypothetical protein
MFGGVRPATLAIIIRIVTDLGGYSLIDYAVGNITTGLPRWMYVFSHLRPHLHRHGRMVAPRAPRLAIERVAANRQGVKNHHFKWYQVRQAAQDPKTWLLFVLKRT